MYKDVVRRMIASILVICMIGSMPDWTLLAGEGGKGAETAASHTYTYGSENAEDITTNNSIAPGEWIANAFAVEPNQGSSNNVQILKSVQFALDKSGHYGNGAGYITSAEYEIGIYKYGAGADVVTVLNGTAEATVSGKYEAEKCDEQDYFNIDISEDEAQKVLLGAGENFAVKVTLNSAKYQADGKAEAEATQIYYKSSVDEKAISYVNGTKSDKAVHIKAVTEEAVEEIQVEKIQFTETEERLLLAENATRQLEVLYTPATTSQRELSWESEDEDIAIVSDTGVVTAIAKGSTTIAATVEGTEKTAKIYIDVCKDIANLTYEGLGQQIYTGEAIAPGFVIKDGDKELKDHGFAVSYKDNINAGTAKVTVTANGNGYIGTKELSFEIAKADLTKENIVATSMKEYTYEGEPVVFDLEGKKPEEIEQILQVKYTNRLGHEIQLVYDKDYVIAKDEAGKPIYGNNNGPSNDAYVVLQAKEGGNYSGQKNCRFVIKAAGDTDTIHAAVDTPTYTYDGSAHKSKVTVKDGTTVLELGKDYTVTYDTDVTSAGEKTIQIQGIGAYADYTETVTYRIHPREITEDNGVVVSKLPNQLTGVTADTLQGLQITYAGKTLAKGSDYTVAVAEGNGEVTITVTGTGNFQGINTQIVKVGTDISTCTVEVAACTYNGKAQTPKVTVKNGGNEVAAENYFLTWENNTDAGSTAKVIVSGVGTYAGINEQTFTIAQKNITDSEIKLTYDTEVTYQKPAVADTSANSSKVVLQFGGETLKADRDYTVTYTENTGVTGAAKITIEAKGNYTGTLTETYAINPADLAGEDVKYTFIDGKEYTYTGSEIKPEIIVTQNGVTLDKGIDYTILYDKNVNIGGAATVILTGIGNYAGSGKELSFIIKGVGIADAQVTAPTQKDYTGAAIELTETELEVTVNGKKLTWGTDYVVNYENNTEAGQAIAELTGIGNYSGFHTITFDIIKDIASDIAKDTITIGSVPTQQYAGVPVKPKVIIMDRYKDDADTVYQLVEGTDYTLSYSNEDAIGTATVTITGQKYYKGTKTLTYTIEKGDLSDASKLKVRLKNANANARRFTGSPVQPEMVVTYDGNELEKNKHYTIEYFYYTKVNAGAHAVITGKDKFEGRWKQPYDILAKDITSDPNISIEVESIDILTLKANGYPTVKVKDMGREKSGEKATSAATEGFTMVNGRDYSLENVTLTAEGGATVDVCGQNDYEGRVTVAFSVEKTDIGGSEVQDISSVLPEDEKNFVYTGKTPELHPVVTVNGETQIQGTDFEVVTTAKTVGSGYTYTLRFIGTGMYTGSFTPLDTFAIIPKNIGDADVVITPISNQIYTGFEIRPLIELRYNGSTVSAADYTVAYANNVNMGTATVTITGKNNFNGTKAASFAISKDITKNLVVSGIAASYPYTSKPICPEVTVTLDGKSLVKGTDYNIIYGKNINANEEASVTIVGIGSYAGEVKRTFAIERISILDTKVHIDMEHQGTHIDMKKDSITGLVFTGKEIQPKVTVTYELADGSHYELTRENSEESVRDYDITISSSSAAVGESVVVTIRPSGINFYTPQELVQVGGFSKQYTIVPKPIADENNKLLADYEIPKIENCRYKPGVTEYKPEITIKDKGRTENGVPYTLVEGIDYTLTYTNNDRAGTANFTITGKGNYSENSSYTGEFKILPNLDTAKVTIPDQIYSGKALTPKAVVSFEDGVILREGTDYKCDFDKASNRNVGTAKVKIIGLNDYAGVSVDGTFQILPKNIEDGDIVVKHVGPSYEWTGENVTPVPNIYYNGMDLIPNTDFICTYQDVCSKAGTTYTFTITGVNNFTGVLTNSYEVGDNFTKNTVQINLPEKSFVYSGKEIEPEFTITLKSDPNTVLSSERDYVYEYDKNLNAGTAYIYAYGNPNTSEYAGDVTAEFVITPKNIGDEDITIDAIADAVYANQAIAPTPAVRWNGQELIAGEDFTYGYRNNIAVGTATLTVTGKGNFTGTKSITFAIQPKNLADAASGITISDIADQIYTGSAIEPKPQVKWNTVLDARTDYTVSYENNTQLGIATVWITGKGNYTGTISKEFRIIKVPMNQVEVECQNTWQYTGKPIEPPVNLFYTDSTGRRIVIAKTEYTVVYSNNIVSGGAMKETAVVTITGIGSCEGVRNYYFTIEPRKISDTAITVDSIPNQVLDASNKAEPKPTVVFRPDSQTTYKLEEGKDYTVSYENNTVVGTNGKVVITGLNNFTGSITKEFYIGKDLRDYIDGVQFKETPNYIYNGKAQLPEIKVILKSGESADMVEGRDYEILYDGKKKDEIQDDTYATKAGTHTVAVSGLAPYGGQITLNYEIQKKNLDEVQFTVDNQMFTGEEIRPYIVGEDARANTRLEESGSTATINGGAAKENMFLNANAFTSQYEGNCTEVGKVTVKLTATETSNYTGSTTVQFEILPKDLRGEDISNGIVERQDYTGTAIKPGIELKDRKRNATGGVFRPAADKEYYTLAEGVDYEISYTNNIYPGIVTMTVTGKNHYTNTLTKQFEIVADLSKAVIAPIPNQQYKDGEPVTPELQVTLGNRTLRRNFDYNVTYSNNTERGTATATIIPVTGSMYTGSQSVNFEISREITGKTVKLAMTATSFVYTGAPIMPTVVVKYGDGEPLVEGQDYTVAYENNINVGTATVKVTGTGAFVGTVTGDFTIVRRSIVSCAFENVTEQYYTGEPTTQNLVVIDGNRALVENQDYTIVYVNNINPGIGTMTITGKGNYGGVKTIHYMIHVQGMTKVASQAYAKSITLSWQPVTGANGYAVYDTDNRMIAKTAATSYKHKNLKSMKTYGYKVRPYMISDGVTYYGDFSNTVSVVTTPTKPSVKVKAGTKKMKVSWKKIKGVSGYEIYRSTKKNGKYKKIKTIKKASIKSYTDKKLKNRKRYYYKVRAYKKVNGKKIYGVYSSVKSKKTK